MQFAKIWPAGFIPLFVRAEGGRLDKEPGFC